MQDPDDFVFLTHAKSPLMARMLVSLLESEGIIAIAPGTDLKDEWASVLQVTGQIGCEVQVPAGKLDEARAILQAAKEAGEDL